MASGFGGGTGAGAGAAGAARRGGTAAALRAAGAGAPWAAAASTTVAAGAAGAASAGAPETGAGRNNALDLYRLLMSLCIVAIHAQLFRDRSPALYAYVSEILLSRTAIPYFACLSGFYFHLRLQEGKPCLGAQLRKLMRVYVFWTCVSVALSFVAKVLVGKEPLPRYLFERAVYFFTQGNFPHLWYFPAIMYAMSLTWLARKAFGDKGVLALSALSALLFLLGVLTSSYAGPAARAVPAVAGLEAAARGVTGGYYTFRNAFEVCLPSFLLGCALSRPSARAAVARAPGWALSLALALGTLLYAGEGAAVVFLLGARGDCYLLFSHPFFVAPLFAFLLRHPMPRLAAPARWARKVAVFTMFFHPYVVVGLPVLAGFAGARLNPAAVWAAALASSLLGGLALARLDRPWSNYALGLAPFPLARRPARGGAGEAPGAGKGAAEGGGGP
jgi:hypothetical protein